MPNPLGIYTPYKFCDLTMAMLSLADQLRHRGNMVSLLSQTANAPCVGSYWDTHRLKYRKNWTAWGKARRLILWGFCPPTAVLEWAGKQGLVNILVADGSNIDENCKDAIPRFSVVVAPFRTTAINLNSYYGAKARDVPWSFSLPLISKRQPIRGKVKLFFPLWDRVVENTPQTVLETIRHCCRQDFQVTVAYTPSLWLSAVKRRLSELDAEFSNLRLLRSPRFGERHSLLAEHHLTVLPSNTEFYWTTPLLSLWAGTPVLGYKLPTFEEFLTEDNSILLNCELCYNRVGMAQATPDRHTLHAALTTRNLTPSRLALLQQQCQAGLPERQDSFVKRWQEFLLPLQSSGDLL